MKNNVPSRNHIAGQSVGPLEKLLATSEYFSKQELYIAEIHLNISGANQPSNYPPPPHSSTLSSHYEPVI